MVADFIIAEIKKHLDECAFIQNDRQYSYRDLLKQFEEANRLIEQSDIAAGEVVAIEADFSPASTALLLALINHNCIIVPITRSVKEKRGEFLEVGKVQRLLRLNDEGEISEEKCPGSGRHELYDRLREINHPGLVLFSSGSTGVSKGTVHDFSLILEKYKTPRRIKRMLTFLLFDHIGGINTLFHNLANGGCIITIRDRTPDTVLAAVEKYRVEVLPVTPTFINLILLSECYKKYDLSSLDTVSYGTEVMPESTLRHFHDLFPGVRLLQTYGLSEIGIMQTKSKSSDSLWVKLGGDGFDWRIVDQMLEIKAKSGMLGYLNAPSPFTEDGYFRTMDMVEVDGEYLKILGRKSELINVGGEKVYPAEVESALLDMTGVKDASVKGEPHPFMGNIVTAKVILAGDEPAADFKRRMRAFLRERLPAYKIPQKVEIVEDGQFFSERFKKMRK